jgi:organic radical activating enzyme
MTTEPNDPRLYTVNEIFYSVQGEGQRAGTANVFVRFSGCNLQCRREEQGFDCDTEFTSGRKLTAAQILGVCQRLAPTGVPIILTGGEPSLQIDAPLLATLKQAGHYLAIETNGTNALPDGLDWITVSPKTAEHTLRQRTAHEVKYVRAEGQGIPKPTVKAEHYLISPACQPDGTYHPADLQWCVGLVKEYPQWKLSLQTHKLLQVR